MSEETTNPEEAPKPKPKPKPSRWFGVLAVLEFILEMLDAALRHLRHGPERAAVIAQRTEVERKIASLKGEEPEDVA